MRSLEWLFLASFIPVLLIPFIPQTIRRRWLMVFAPLPVVVGIVHLVAEGWRIQMVALYVLAVLILASRLPELRGRDSSVRRRRGMLVSLFNALIVIGSAVLAGWLLPVINLPQPTGPYQVGLVDRELVDEARGRRLMVSVWYPTAQHSTPALLTHNPDAVTTGLGQVFGVTGLPLQHLRYFTLAASEDVPVLADASPFPILVFSHGMVGLRLQNSTLLQELASWGYVVVAIDHTDAAAVTVFPDGETRFYNLERFGIPADVEPDRALVTEHVFPVWIADQRFVYDTLETWAKSDPLLAGKLDVTRIGSLGHSFGGATALEMCRIEPRCQAAIDLDGGLYGDILTQPTAKPLLLMISEGSSQNAEAMDRWTQMVTAATGPAYWLELPHSTHLSFTITQLLSPLLVPEDFDARDGLHVIDKYVRAFFDSYVRGGAAFPPQSASTETDVRWIKS